MVFKKIVKFIPALIYSVLILGVFYWQFNTLYSTIIESFKEEKLSTLYTYLFLYLFGVYMAMMGLIQLLDYFILKNRYVIQITSLILLLFYGFSFHQYYHIIEYFINYPLSQNSIMGMFFFMILNFGYSFYSIIILFFKEHIPVTQTLVFLLVGLTYMLYFMHNYGKPISQLIS